MSRARDLANGTFSGAFSADSPTLVVDAANNRVGIGTATPGAAAIDAVTSTSGVLVGQFENSHATGSYGVVVKAGSGSGNYTADFRNKDNTTLMRIRGDGNVGIGTTSPSQQLTVSNTGGGSSILINTANTSGGNLLFGDTESDTSGRIGYVHSTDYMYFNTANTERMRINNAGSVSIGTASSPNNAPLLVHCATDDNIRIKQETHAAIQAVNDAASAFVELKLDGSSLLLNSQSSGKVLVGTTSTFDNVSFLGIQSLGGLATKIAGTAATSQVSFFNDNGRVGYIGTSGTSTSYNTSSDYRLKENVADLTGAIDRVKQVPVHRFNFIADPDKTVDGFLAHEVADVVPEAITGEKDAMRTEEYEVTPAVYEDVIIPAVLDDEGNEVEAERTETQLVTEAVMGTREVIDPQGIDQSKLVPLLTAAIKEQQALIEDLQTRLAALEAV